MKAKEANETAKNRINRSIDFHYDKIMKEIEVTAQNGFFSTHYGKGFPETYKVLKQMLEAEGYKVRIETDQPTGLEISWK